MMSIGSYEVYDVDFGTVNCGLLYVKTFSDPHFLQIKEVSQYADSSVIDTRFSVSLDEKDSSYVKIKFMPERPGSFHCTYYKLVNVASKVYNICLKGRTEDLAVTATRMNIEIKAHKKGDIKLTWFDLINSSKSTAIFQFQHDETQCDIKLTPRFGKLTPGETLRVILTYTPSAYGIHYRLIYCYIQHHPPLVIEVQTFCQKTPEYDTSKLYFIESIPKSKCAFQYIFDGTQKVFFDSGNDQITINPPIVLNRKYLDFHSKSLCSGDAPVTITVTASNLSPVNILVRWQLDKNGVFEIIPNFKVIQRGTKFVFVVTFRPHSNDNFYSVILHGSLHWGDGFSYVVPYHLMLDLIGNSFEEDQHGWLGEYKVPKRIIIPPCVPKQITWTTFILRRYGHLPLMFRFLPAEGSHFRFVPQHGVVTEDFQIILVEFSAGLITGTIHREKRKVLFNTSILVDLEIIGTIENPNIWFPNGDIVEFPSTPINCTLESYIEVKNITRHLLRFNFETVNDDLICSKMNKDFILPGEQAKLWLSFSPNSLGDYSSTRYLSIFCQNSTNLKTISNKHLIKFYGTSVIPRLTCVPENLSLGSFHRDDVTINYFVISNIGDCTCFIKLQVVSKEPLSIFKEMIFDPQYITLDPGKEIKVLAQLTADTAGYQFYEILAVICKTQSFKEDEEVTRIHLLNVNYFCYSYKFKITDVVNLDGDEITVPKYHLWNILNIDGMNDKLKSCSTNFTEESVEMKVPEYEVGAKILRIMLILENLSDVHCTFHVAKTTPCDCPPYTTKTGYVLERPDSLCPHRSQIHFDPSTEKFKPKEKKPLTITVYYNDPTITRSNFRISIFCTSHPSIKHHITLNITRNIIKDEEFSADICQYDMCCDTSKFSLENINIGTPCPPIQALWFYNNSRVDVDYRVIIEDIDKEYLECYNPKGQIPAESQYLILLKFIPLRPIEYKATLKCKMGVKQRIVKINGKGVLHNSRNLLLTGTKMPFSYSFTQQNTPVHTSINHLILDNMATHAIAKKIIHIKNDSNVPVIFKWSTCTIENVITITVKPQEGSLKPNEVATVSIKAQTFHMSFILTLTMLCSLSYDEYFARNIRKKTSTASKRSFNYLKTPSSLQSYASFNKSKSTSNDTTAALPKNLSVTVAINCSDIEWLEKLPPRQLKYKWKLHVPQGPCLDKWNAPSITPTLTATISELFSHIILNTLESKQFQKLIAERKKPKYFSDVEAASKNNKLPCRVATTPIVGDIVDEVLFCTFSKFVQSNNKYTS